VSDELDGGEDDEDARNSDLETDEEPAPFGSARGPEPAAYEASIHRVRKAYEQVYDQLRELIVSGEVQRGERLPNETVLAREFGVSRGTVREALRILAAQNLIRTAKGAGGGSFVTLPTVDHISEFLQANISLLSDVENVELGEFLEARDLLEVFAARLAARRHTEADVERMRQTIVDDPLSLTAEGRFAHNKEFHSAVLGASGNTLLCISAQPIFSILQTNLSRTKLESDFPVRVNDHHREILDAIETGDGAAAEKRMHEHLEYLRDTYEKIWRDTGSKSRS
jgi:DNA-binding FadR family transcriptional regulator